MAGIVSDDGRITITEEEVKELEADLPNVKNMRGQIRFFLRELAPKGDPQTRLKRLYYFLAERDQQGAEREQRRLAAERQRRGPRHNVL